MSLMRLLSARFSIIKVYNKRVNGNSCFLKRGIMMDNVNSSEEIDMVFAETKTIYDFYELEEEWEAKKQKHNHPVSKLIHKKAHKEHTKFI